MHNHRSLLQLTESVQNAGYHNDKMHHSQSSLLPPESQLIQVHFLQKQSPQFL